MISLFNFDVKHQAKKFRHLKKYRKIFWDEVLPLSIPQWELFKQFIYEKEISSFSKFRKRIIYYRDCEKFRLICILNGVIPPPKNNP